MTKRREKLKHNTKFNDRRMHHTQKLHRLHTQINSYVLQKDFSFFLFDFCVRQIFSKPLLIYFVCCVLILRFQAFLFLCFCFSDFSVHKKEKKSNFNTYAQSEDQQFVCDFLFSFFSVLIFKCFVSASARVVIIFFR